MDLKHKNKNHKKRELKHTKKREIKKMNFDA